MTVRVGVMPVGRGDLGSRLPQIAAHGLDHMVTGDHVSFFVGAGTDGLISAAHSLGRVPELPVFIAVYLLALRHPVPVARQLASIAELAPGRLTFGVGVGGEDPHEFEVCGVDPHSRGRRTDEALEVVRSLLTGGAVTHHGEFFDLDDAMIVPAPDPVIPIIVGGRSDAALRRAARFGDGWIGIWNSAKRFSEAIAAVETTAADAGRADVEWQHAMQLWCGFGADSGIARPPLAAAMEAMYQIPFERFERYSPYGPPAAVAEFLVPYRDAGCSTFNLIACAVDPAEAIAGAAEVKRLLNA
ncbi:MAG: hypothetical protein NVSMB16_15180 [Acidimicrobiales bacterium]